MALTERLQILVTADGKGAVNEFSRIGATAEKELGRTDDRLKRLSSGLVANGTQIAVAGGLATAGIFALAKASGDYEEAASAAGVIFGDSAEAIEDFGKKAINSAGLSRRAAVEAANTFGTFGKAAGLTGDDLAAFSTDLTQLAGDLASFKNTSTEEAITAIGAALRGESEPIRRYGVLLDDATLKQEALALGIYDGNGALDQQSKVLAAQAAIFKQTTDAQGDYQRTSESLSNQTRAFTAQLDNLKVGLGDGAVPVFSELVGVANDALLKFQELNPETQDIVGRLGAIGALGATAIGGLAVIGGGVLRLVDTFGSLRQSLTNTQGELTRTGQVASTAGKVIGGAVAVGGVLLLADALFQLSQNAGNTQEALDRFKLAAPKGDAQQTLSVLNSLGEGYKDLGDALLEPIVGSPVIKTSDEFGVSLANVDRAINDLYKSGNIEGARVALEALGDVKLRPDNAENLDAINGIIDKYTPKLNAAEGATKGVGRETSFLDQVLQGAARGMAAAESATDDLAGSFDKANAEIELSSALLERAAGRASAFLGAVENSSAVDDLLGASLDLRDSSVALLDGVGALAGVDVEKVASGFTKISDEASEALRDVLSVGEDAQASIAAALQFQGADVARTKANDIRDGLVGVLDAAGVADDQIRYLLETIGLADWQIEASIEIAGEAEALATIEAFRQAAELLEAPIEIQAQVAQAQLEGRLGDAKNLIDLWVQDRQDGLLTNPLLVAITLGDTTELRSQIESIAGEPGTPNEIQIQVGAALSEGRLDDAANLLQLWKQDQEDGTISDPLLVAMGLGDTQLASDEVQAWKNSEEQKPPADIPVDANVDPATQRLNNLRQAIPLFGNSVRVDADTSPALSKLAQLQQAIPIFGVGGAGGTIRGGFDVKIPDRAVGGRTEAGRDYFVNEPSLGGELFRPSTDGFVMSAADTDRLLRGVEALVNGGGSGVVVNQKIASSDPIVTAREAARKMRDAMYLAAS